MEAIWELGTPDLVLELPKSYVLPSGNRDVFRNFVLPIPIDANTIDALQLKESYIGFSLGAEPQGLRGKFTFPVEQAQGIAKIVFMFVALQQQAN